MHKIRAEITKGEEIRYISHLDYASVIERSLRRAQFPVAYSEGFNPHIKLSFASALAVGVTSDAEYMDVEFYEPVSVQHFVDRMRCQLPQGIRLCKAQVLQGKHPAMMAVVDEAVYTVKVPFGGSAAMMAEVVQAYNEAAAVVFLRKTPKVKKEIEIKQFMAAPLQVQVSDQVADLCMRLKIMPSGSVKPGEILQVLIGQFSLPIAENEAQIHRTGLYVKGKPPLV